MDIRIDDLSGPEIAALLQEHLADMHATSPRESVHALDLSGLQVSEITFWTVWDGPTLAGCGALKQHDAGHAEIKSMRVAGCYRQRGVASLLMRHILSVAVARTCKRLSLETGSQAYFEPARRLYAKHGFLQCGPFADYKLDPNSVFMSRPL